MPGKGGEEMGLPPLLPKATNSLNWMLISCGLTRTWVWAGSDWVIWGGVSSLGPPVGAAGRAQPCRAMNPAAAAMIRMVERMRTSSKVLEKWCTESPSNVAVLKR